MVYSAPFRDQLRSRTPLSDLVGRCGLKLVRRGRELVRLYPFHRERATSRARRASDEPRRRGGAAGSPAYSGAASHRRDRPAILRAQPRDPYRRRDLLEWIERAACQLISQPVR
jgi:hypothetical protein